MNYEKNHRRIVSKKELHIEVPGCIVNIRPGLTGAGMREVTSIEIICDQYAGERHWYMPDLNGDNPPRATNIRVVRESEEDRAAREAKGK